jgi:type I restriction-modification system DNA methylase subunit
MNPDQARNLVGETFMKSFDKARFRSFVLELLNEFDESKAFTSNKTYIKDAFKNHVERFERLGTYTSADDEKLDVLVVHLTKQSKLERARAAIRNFVADHLKQRDGKDAALVAFVSPTEQQWRFSYVKMEYATVEKDSGKIGVETKLTPARRFSYIVGEGESCHTAQTRFLGLLQDTETAPALAQIEDAFSVDAVTKEFFKKYAELFGEIQKALDKVARKDPAIAKEFEKKNVRTADFAKKLMGQIVFLYFIQKKGWLGVDKGKDWGTGPHDFLRRLARGEYGGYENFFNDILEPLFYDTLATDRGHEAWCKRFNCRIPFLNGGLFEPLADYDWRKTDIVLPNRLFMNNEHFDDFSTGTGLLDMFDRYNFTVNEAEPLEKEVAIDPEMLGKVFENLIEENLRKGLGSYYTPREVVHYMCQESLINYLDTALNCGSEPIWKERRKQAEFGDQKSEQTLLTAPARNEIVPRADIETFIHLGDQASFFEDARVSGTTSYSRYLPKSIEKHARLIDEKLANITICDPAVGSGAFPVGMMTEIVRARSALTSYFNERRERTAYRFKHDAIQNCLYGVDIDPGAVEIAKLRLWLSLVVDEQDVRRIKPLPNLFYKIVTGNSLLGVEKTLFNQQLFQKLEKLKPLYFDQSDQSEKAALRRQIDDLIHELTNGKEAFDFEIYFSEVFHLKGGFDVIIANPPYVFTRDADFTPQFKAFVKREYFSLVDTQKKGRANQSGKINLFGLFLFKGILLNGPTGIVTFITPNNLLRTTTYDNIRKFILQRSKILEIVDLGSGVFENVTASTVITTLQKCGDEQSRNTNLVSAITEIEDIESRVFALNQIQQSVFLNNVSYAFNLFVRGDVRSVIVKLENIKSRLGDYCADIIEGIVAHKHLIEQKPRNHSYVPLVEGKCVKRYVVLPPKKYLKWDRDEIHRARPDYLWRAGEKILVQRISGGLNPITAALDTSKSKTFASVNNILLKKEFENYYKYVLALLNSRLLNWYYANCFSNNSELTVNISKTYLEQLPFVPPDKDTQRIVTIVDRILAAKQRNADADTRALEREIDNLVYALYGLTPEEIQIVEGANENR